MIVGCFASGLYGEPRLTQDIDIVIAAGADDVRKLCAEFPAKDFYVSLEAAGDAARRRSQFNILHPASGTKIDFMVARTDPWGRLELERRQRVRILPDREGYIARPEDVIISKMQYYKKGGSEKHLRDVAGILKVSGEKVNRAYIEHWAEEFGLKEIWDAIQKRLSAPTTKE
jgi:hypothetical protein